MAQHRTALPVELKELIVLIRAGMLFDVQRWIRERKPVRLPSTGRFAISPALAAVRTGNHSMVQVILDEVASNVDLGELMAEAVAMKRLDLCQLIHHYGGNPQAVCYESVASSHIPIGKCLISPAVPTPTTGPRFTWAATGVEWVVQAGPRRPAPVSWPLSTRCAPMPTLARWDCSTQRFIL